MEKYVIFRLLLPVSFILSKGADVGMVDLVGYTSRWINTGEIACDGGDDDDANEIEVTAV